MKIYTRTGDKGETSLSGGQRVSKSDPRVEVYGTLDELNSFVGLFEAELRPDSRFDLERQWLAEIQDELFRLGMQVSTPRDAKNAPPALRPNFARSLETQMDQMTEHLPELTFFILPGGSRPGSLAHVCRTVCRRAERLMVDWGLAPESEAQIHASVALSVLTALNRLSDFFFVFARHANHRLQVVDVEWKS